jgi:NADP-dependent 3-hydroxy acid dehydrogenase YdfG
MRKEFAVVSGAASGIGRAIANRLSIDFTVIGIDINEEKLMQVQSEIASTGGFAYSLVGDVSNRQIHIDAREFGGSLGELKA